MKIVFDVPGEPVGKGRPRFTRSGRTYTPRNTSDYEEHVRTCFKGVFLDWKPAGGCVNMSLNVNCKIPESWPKWKKLKAASGCLKPTVKPDLDNVAKIILDALNGVAYVDDKNITCLHVEKRYSNVPGVMVTIETEDSNGT